MIDRASLAAFQAVLQTGSFEGAAAELHLSQPAVSARIKGLEERLGTALIRRTRPATPTEAGRRLLAHAETLHLLERDLARDLAGARPDPASPLRIAVTADSLATWVLPALASVEGLLYDLIIDDQDHSAELLRAGEVAGAITASTTTVPGCDATALGDLTYVAFASPGFAATHFAEGVTRATLAAAPAITYSRKDRLQRAWAERAAGGKVGLRTHYLGSTHGITEAARAGLGWAVNPAPLIAPHFAAGHLVPLRPDITLATPLVWQVPRQNAAALRDLTRALVAASRKAAVS